MTLLPPRAEEPLSQPNLPGLATGGEPVRGPQMELPGTRGASEQPPT